MNVELTVRGEIDVLRVRPGDILVLSTDSDLSRELGEELTRQAESLVPGTRVVVLGRGWSLSAARSEEQADG